jgi:hypothetical protein
MFSLSLAAIRSFSFRTPVITRRLCLPLENVGVTPSLPIFLPIAVR